MRICILGPLEAWDAAGRAVPVTGSRLRQLLIRLAIDAGQTVAADRLAEDLWPQDQPAEAANALQALVSRLRRAAGREAIEYGPGGYRLAVDAGAVDAAEFEQLVGAARGALADGDQAGAAGTLRRALGLWRGPALADAQDAPFAAAAITRLEELRLAALEDRIEADLALGLGAELVPEAEALTAAHPLRERLRGQLMRALCAAGRQADALAVYEDTRALLAGQLGVDPSPALAAVHLAVLRGEAGPPVHPEAQAPAGPPAPEGRPQRRGSNLPAQLTSFVGRDDELRQVAKLLAASRLVTLTGPGGAGKTRLSIEASADQLAHAPDGVWFVPLAPVRDAVDVPQAVLTAMGLPETAHLAETVVPPLDRLADALSGQQTLLVLDNCEHLVDTVAGLAGRVLADAPRVRILATSREPLGLTGETLCPVPSLRLPPGDATAQDAVNYPAVRLFADRAAAVKPGFAVTEDTVAPVVRICRALDGIPLAIELAAARLRALTPGQVADRLDDRFRLLSVGSRGVLPRHQTLRAIVDWSWDLLNKAERTTLRRLSVFSGGATPDSAERVCALGGDPSAVIDVIASLADKSLVVATGDPQVRYRLLETVRAYAAERLAEAGEEEQVRGAHVAYFLEMAERAEPELRGHDQIEWLARLATEHDNLTGALRHAVAAHDGALGVRLVAALAWFWMLRDYDSEAAQWAREVHEVTGGTPPPGLTDAHTICEFMAIVSPREDSGFLGPTQVRDALDLIMPLIQQTKHPLVAMAAPVLAVLTGNQDLAYHHLADLAGHPEPWTRAAHRMFRGHLAANLGQIEQAAPDLTAALAEFGEIGDRWGMIVSLAGLAEVALARGRPAEAIKALEEANGHASEDFAGPWGETMCIQLGRARARLGDFAAARADIDRGLRVANRTGNKDDEATGYIELSELARAEGNLASARNLLERALAIAEPIAQRPDMRVVAATAFGKLGCVCEQAGDLDAAAGWHAKALGALVTTDVVLLPSNPGLAVVVEGIAALAAARGELTRAVELLGLAHTLQGFSHSGNLEVARVTVAAQTLDRAGFEAAYARGRAMDREDALSLVP